MQAVQIICFDWHHNYSGRLLPPSPPLLPDSIGVLSGTSANSLSVSPCFSHSTALSRFINPRPWSWSYKPRKTAAASSPYSPSSSSSAQLPKEKFCYTESARGGDVSVEEDAAVGDYVGEGDCNDVEIEIDIIGNNSRRIRSRIPINASLITVWNILTDYERLADIIPGLAVSRVLETSEKFARLFQVGQQKLAFGINFNAKGIIDCYEKDLENFPFGQRRDIEFKMIEGDFQLFEGKWSIEHYNAEGSEDGNPLVGQEFYTTLSYTVDVVPKLWLPVRLVEGRLCSEIKTNLLCIREEAQNANMRLPVID